MAVKTKFSNNGIAFSREEVIEDYTLACLSREVSILGRKEVFSGKAKFGIFSDGKEVAQIAMAKYFKDGDFRSGYYRDQTFMMAIGALTPKQVYAQLYGHGDLKYEPHSGGRMMVGHFGSWSLDEKGEWNDLTKIKNAVVDISPTSAQMPRLVGFGYASKLYRNSPDLKPVQKGFSNNGNEVGFGTIGNAAVAEGLFFEAVNASGVLQIPVIMSIWDDGYGISVPQEYQTTKLDISEVLQGFRRTKKERGIEIYQPHGWDYEELCTMYQEAAELARKKHVPSVMHVIELTQPLGHSTSGSHTRYKSKERLQWEDDFDCNKKMREWILKNKLGTKEELDAIEKKALQDARKYRDEAWKDFLDYIRVDHEQALVFLAEAAKQSRNARAVQQVHDELKNTLNPIKSDAVKRVKEALWLLRGENIPARQKLIGWKEKAEKENEDRFNSHIYSASKHAAIKVKEVKPVYTDKSKLVDGREVIQACFDAALKRDPRIAAFGEDVGKIGDVNQGMAGLQDKYGEMRVGDTGIREATIIGQAIGMSMRGLRPIAEVQYLDYVLFCIQTLSDDVATLHYRTKGKNKAPLIVRTRGHRLEGMFHSGSLMGMLMHALRGMYLLTPRDFTQAAGMYNTLFESDDPALVIESLNGYRLKEKLPANIGEMKVPLGVPEVIREGKDLTIVTYGSMCRIAVAAADALQKMGISVEVVDVQTLMPFDIHHKIVESIKKTNRVIFTDEDVSGGATGYMMQQVLEEQKGYFYLDSEPRTVPGMDHRPAYSSDGDYFSKPNMENLVDVAYELMHEANPTQFPPLYK